MAKSEQIPAGELNYRHLGRSVAITNNEERYAVQGVLTNITHIAVLRQVSIEIDLGGQGFTEHYNPDTPINLLGDYAF